MEPEMVMSLLAVETLEEGTSLRVHRWLQISAMILDQTG